MTTESHRNRDAAGPSIHVVRARKLLLGGLAGGVGAAILAIIAFTIIEGTRGLGSTAFGAGLVLFFYAVGELVMVRMADAGARTLLMGSMVSYTGRVVILGLILLIFSQHAHSWSWVDARALFIGAIAVVAGWILVEVVVFSRLRIAIYDTEYQPPASADQAADQAADQDLGSGSHDGQSGDKGVEER